MARKLEFDTQGNEKQKQAMRLLLDKVTKDIGYGGAAGGGKSYTGVAWQWMMRIRYPGTRGFFGRKELKKLKATTLATYYKFCADYKVPVSQRGVFNQQDSVVRFSNGSEIHLLDLSHQPSDPLYTRFGSYEFTDGFIDESAEVDEEAIKIIRTRIGRQRNGEYGLAPKLLQTFNPDKGHVYRNFWLPYRNGTESETRKFIQALPTDNKRLEKAYIGQLQESDEVTRQRLLYGNFDYDATPGRLFEYDKILAMPDNPPLDGYRYISCDVAREGKDKSVIVIWHGLIIKEVHVIEKSTLDVLEAKILELAQHNNIPVSNIIVDENGVGGGVKDHLKCLGFISQSKPLQPKSQGSFNLRNYENLKAQCFHALGQYINTGKIRLEATDILGKLSEELDVIVQVDMEKDTRFRIIKKEDIKSKLGRSNDYSDAVMMRMVYEIQYNREYYDPATIQLQAIDEEEEKWIDEEEEEIELDFSAY